MSPPDSWHFHFRFKSEAHCTKAIKSLPPDTRSALDGAEFSKAIVEEPAEPKHNYAVAWHYVTLSVDQARQMLGKLHSAGAMIYIAASTDPSRCGFICNVGSEVPMLDLLFTGYRRSKRGWMFWRK